MPDTGSGDGFLAAAFARYAQGAPLEAILSGMTLRDKVAQMMSASFRVRQEVPPEGAEIAVMKRTRTAKTRASISDAGYQGESA